MTIIKIYFGIFDHTPLEDSPLYPSEEKIFFEKHLVIIINSLNKVDQAI